MLDITLMSCDENAGSWAAGSAGSPFIYAFVAPSPAVKLLAEAQSPSVAVFTECRWGRQECV